MYISVCNVCIVACTACVTAGANLTGTLPPIYTSLPDLSLFFISSNPGTGVVINRPVRVTDSHSLSRSLTLTLTLTLNASTHAKLPTTQLCAYVVDSRPLQCLGSCMVHLTSARTMFNLLDTTGLRPLQPHINIHLTADTGLSGVVVNVSDGLRAKLQLVQLTDTALQMPCATPGMFCDHRTYCCCLF